MDRFFSLLSKGKPRVGFKIWHNSSIHIVGVIARIMKTSTGRVILSLFIYFGKYEPKLTFAFDDPRRKSP